MTIFNAGVPVVSVKDIIVTIGYGHDVTLDCSIISDPPDIIVYWQKEHNGTTTNVTSNNPGISGSTARKPSLTIKEAKEFDAGIYICFALNAVGLARSNEINLTVEGGMIYQIFHVSMYELFRGFHNFDCFEQSLFYILTYGI